MDTPTNCTVILCVFRARPLRAALKIGYLRPRRMTPTEHCGRQWAALCMAQPLAISRIYSGLISDLLWVLALRVYTQVISQVGQHATQQQQRS